MSEVTNILEFGIENLHLAELQEGGTYDAPQHIKGVVNVKLKSKIDTLTLYADNGTYASLTNNNGYEGDMEIYNFDNEFKIKYLGYVKDGNGILVEPAIFYPKPYAMLFKIQGDKQDRCTVLYNVTFTKTDVEHKTIEEKINVETLKINIKATPVSVTGFSKKVVQSSTTDTARTAKWFTKVYTPSDSPSEA